MINNVNHVQAFNELIAGYTCLVSFRLEIDPHSSRYDLVLCMSENEDVFSEQLSYCFYDVGELRLNAVGGGLTQFLHLKLSSIDAGLDRARYELIELEGQKIAFSCFRFALIK